jgi:hypothetical protein
MAPERRWLTIPEAAEAYGLHPKSFYILCTKHLIPYARIPSLRGGKGMIRIDRRKMDEQLEAGELVLDARGRKDAR